MLNFQVESCRKLRDLKDNQRQLLTSSIPSFFEIKGKKDQMIAMEKAIQIIEEKHGLDPYILKEITNIVPKSITLKDISIEYPDRVKERADEMLVKEGSVDKKEGLAWKGRDASAKLEGVVSGEESTLGINLTQFILALDASPFIESPRLLSQKKEKKGLEFSVGFSLR
ncbi:MAG: hypothetical protein V1872_00375 [bacterium]